ncbi:hypothetical protein CNR22_03605 [Sphingobacteriaceae bacterium]|nr:hypothetical protein CNR22_03605 [Sphingobacteriaceae bacterium]
MSGSDILFKPGGTLVSYAIAFALNINKSAVMLLLALKAKLLWLNYLSNDRKAGFYNIWSGKGSDKFRREIKEDFAELMKLLENGIIKQQIAAKFPLEKITEAVELADSRNIYGKAILIT